MDRRKAWMVGGAVAVLALGGAGTAFTTGDDDEALTGSALEQATAAALAHTGGGTVTETEVGDGGAAYGVEIRLDDGRVVEVGLDENFQVIGQEAEDDGTNGEVGSERDGAED